jgi:hypothetical protein
VPNHGIRARFQWLAVCVAAVLVPILAGTFVPPSEASGRFGGWVDQWDGATLKRIDFTWRERAFREGFPGQVAHFSDGRRELIMRYTERATRKLLSAEECFRNAGFKITPLDVYGDNKGRNWSLFEAEKFGETLRVSERVTDRRGREWLRVGSWYWAATFGWSSGPWWTITVVERLGSR